MKELIAENWTSVLEEKTREISDLEKTWTDAKDKRSIERKVRLTANSLTVQELFLASIKISEKFALVFGEIISGKIQELSMLEKILLLSAKNKITRSPFVGILINDVSSAFKNASSEDKPHWMIQAMYYYEDQHTLVQNLLREKFDL